MGAKMDLIDQRFGFLTAVRPDGLRRGTTMWLCQCDCGRVCHAQRSGLRYGRNRSCGRVGCKAKVHRLKQPFQGIAATVVKGSEAAPCSA